MRAFVSLGAAVVAAAVSLTAVEEPCPPPPAPASLPGRVADAAGGNVAGARVTTWTDARVRRTVHADAAGRFRVDVAAGDSAHLRVTAVGYDTFHVVVRPRDRAPLTVTLRRTPEG